MCLQFLHTSSRSSVISSQEQCVQLQRCIRCRQCRRIRLSDQASIHFMVNHTRPHIRDTTHTEEASTANLAQDIPLTLNQCTIRGSCTMPIVDLRFKLIWRQWRTQCSIMLHVWLETCHSALIRLSLTWAPHRWTRRLLVLRLRRPILQLQRIRLLVRWSWIPSSLTRR